MTKSTITREESVQAVFDLKVGYRLEFADLEILKRVARMALAAMDSEPVFILEVARADYKGQKLGNHFGFITLDAARELKEGNYQLYAAQPAPVIPDEMTPEQAYEIGDYHGDPVEVFARGANWMRQHILESTLAAAPQSPGSEPATVPVIPARLVDSVTEVLRMLDEYPERLVPVNRQSALIRELRSAVLEAASIERGKQ